MARILNIVPSAYLAGTERSNLLRLKGLQKRGYTIKLLSLRPMGALAGLLDEAGIEFEGLKYRGPFGLWNIGRIRGIVRQFNPDAILMTEKNIVASLAVGGICPGHRLLCIHNHIERRFTAKIIYRQAVGFFNHICFNSAFLRNEALGIYPGLAEHSSVLYNPFELPKPVSPAERTRARKIFGLAPRDWVIGNAGQLIARKRFDVFIEVLARLNRERPVRALIAGDGPLRKELESLAAQKGVGRLIQWLGWHKDLRHFYAALDVLLFNTDIDALARIPIEAGAMGIPPVCSSVQGGIGEVFNGIPGLEAFPRHDEKALAARCLYFLKNRGVGRVCTSRLKLKIRDIHDSGYHARKVESFLGIA
jgi:glycosyltransferase involved in cell wall biosynthesis